jgi:exosortase
MILRKLANVGWTPWHAVGAIAMGALGVLVTRGAWTDIYHIGTRVEEQSQILLVPFVAAWMAWCRRVRIRFCEPQGVIVGPIICAAGWAMYSIGYNSSTLVLWHMGAVAVVVGCVLTVVGKRVLFRFMPAFLVLVFLIPVPGVIREKIAQPLQTATAAATQAVLEIVGSNIERDGNLLRINGVPVAVAEACNGLRMVFALVLVSYAFAFSMPLRNSVRLLVLAASPLAALVCNVLRLVPTVQLYGTVSEKWANRFHDVSGWLMLPVAFLMLLGIIRLLKWALIPVARYNLAYQ